VRGEVTLVVTGADERSPVTDAAALRAAVEAEEAGGTTRKEAIRTVATGLGVPKRTVYDAVHGVGAGR
jgi:16S rRNA (cytidine1402-2'-O)-methyltransferase